MPRLPSGYWVIEGLPRQPLWGSPPTALTWHVVAGPFESKEAAVAALGVRRLRDRWAIVAALDRRAAVIAAHRALGLPPPPRSAIP